VPFPGRIRTVFRDLAEADRNGTLGTLGLDAYPAASERASITWL
jgi:hypothetical protein